MLKSFLKKILPPPVNAFNREIANTQRQIEQNHNLLEQMQQQNKLHFDNTCIRLEGIKKENYQLLLLLHEQQQKQIELAEQQNDLIQGMNKNIMNLSGKQKEIFDRIIELQANLNANSLELKKMKEMINVACGELDIPTTPIKRDYEYYCRLPSEKYERELKRWYKRVMNEELDLDNPRTFNEKIQWLKLYDSTPLKTRLADKYLVREWVSEKIGQEYLIPLLGVWDNFDDIDFDKLPNKFVLKATHGCGYNIIVKDKNNLDIADARDKFKNWMQKNFALRAGFELHYQNIPHKIIAEQYLENDNNDLYDYKVFCFDGKAESIMYLSDRKSGLKMSFYDLEWNKLPFTYSFPRNDDDVPKPSNLELLIELSEKLSEGFSHVRVDFYILNDGTIKFGEMTFTTMSGFCKWNPPEQNLIYGNLIKLPPKKFNADEDVVKVYDFFIS